MPSWAISGRFPYGSASAPSQATRPPVSRSLGLTASRHSDGSGGSGSTGSQGFRAARTDLSLKRREWASFLGIAGVAWWRPLGKDRWIYFLRPARRGQSGDPGTGVLTGNAA